MPMTARKKMSMTSASLVDSASSRLLWSNVIYVSGAALTLLAAMLVFIERRLIAAGIRERTTLITEWAVIGAAIISFFGTIGAVRYGSLVSHLKDDDLAAYEASAQVQIAQANRDAANANSVAGIAYKNAADANNHLADANSKAADANKQSADANKKAAEANATSQRAELDKTKILNDNLKLQQQIEQEQNSRQKIEQRLAPRNLNGAIQQAMIVQLRPILPRDVDIVLYAGNPEADNLSHQIAWVFQQVNWGFHFAQPMGGSAQGIRIEYDGQDKTTTKAANIIAASLKSSGLEVNALSPNLLPFMDELGAYTSDGKAGSAKIRLIIGSK